MDAKNLIENLISAIDQINPLTADAALIAAIEDAKETAGLAKLVLPSLGAPAAPVGEHFLVDLGNDELIGPFRTDAESQVFGQHNVDPNTDHWERWTVIDPGTYLQANTAQGSPTLPAPQPSLPSSSTHCSCGALLDANGDCSDPGCQPAIMPAQSFDEVMKDLHDTVNTKHRPGSSIAARPPGSLYQN